MTAPPAALADAVLNAADTDQVLAALHNYMDLTGEPPTEADLVDWFAHCPEHARDDADSRIPLTPDCTAGRWFPWHPSPDAPALTNSAGATQTTPCLAAVMSNKGTLTGLYPADVVHHDWAARWRTPANKPGLHPLAPIVEAWQNRPRLVTRNTRTDRILPSRLAMIGQGDQHGGNRLFMHAMRHVEKQLWLPGFEVEQSGPVLPLVLYDLGAGTAAETRGPAAPLALRLWVEAVLSVDYQDRGADDRPTAMSIPLRQLLAALYPGRRPRPNEYWPRLLAAAEALDAPEARIPWQDPETRRGGLRRIVAMSDIPRGPGALDDVVTLTVHLPPGAVDGPTMPASLPSWGIRSAAAYRALIGLAFRWHNPGRTRRPVGQGRRQHWYQSPHPRDYDPLTDEDLITLCYPTSARSARRDLAPRARNVLRQLANAGELILTSDGRVMPPKSRHRK